MSDFLEDHFQIVTVGGVNSIRPLNVMEVLADKQKVESP